MKEREDSFIDEQKEKEEERMKSSTLDSNGAGGVGMASSWSVILLEILFFPFIFGGLLFKIFYKIWLYSVTRSIFFLLL